MLASTVLVLVACGTDPNPPASPCVACPDASADVRDAGDDAGGFADAGDGGTDGATVIDGSTCSPDCSVDRCGFHQNLPRSAQYLRFANAERKVEVLIQRDLVGQGAGHSGIYELRGFALEMSGRVDCHTQGLDYENSHHNWIDRARVHTSQGVLELRIEFQPAGGDPLNEWAWRFPLTGTGKDGRALFAPVELQIVEGNPWGQ